MEKQQTDPLPPFHAPETPALWNNIALILLEKDLYASLFCLKRANYLSPLDTSILYNMGLVFFKLKQFVHSCNIFQAARQIQETSGIPKYNKLAVHCLLMLGLSLWKVGDVKNSRRALNEALKNCNKDAWVYTNYSLFEFHNGNEGNVAFKVVANWYGDSSIEYDKNIQVECLRKMTSSLSV